MTISYPRNLPSTTQTRAMTWRQRAVAAASESPYTSQLQVQGFDGEFWEVDVTLIPLQRADAEAWIGFLTTMRGLYGTFLLGPHGPAATPRGIATGTPLVKGASQTGRSLITDGWTATQTGILKTGDWFSVGSGTTTRLHKVMADANSDGSTNATFDIEPPLRESPADNAPITVTNPTGCFRLKDNSIAWDVDVAQFYTLRFTAREAI